MTEAGLLIDLDRIDRASRDRALTGNSWENDYVFLTQKSHRLHTVCSTLAALGYMTRRMDWRNAEHEESAWTLTGSGLDLMEDLRRSVASRKV